MIAAQIALLLVWGMPLPLAPIEAERQQHNQQEPAASQNNSYRSPDVTANSNHESKIGSETKEMKQNCWQEFVQYVEAHDKVVVAISTIVIAAFTVALFAATFALWWASKKHSERELRAYVFPIKAWVDNFGTTEVAEATVEIKNSGKTPAYEFNIVGTIDIKPFPATEFPALPDTGIARSEGALAPGMAVDVVRPARRVLTKEEHRDVLEGKKAVYVFGQATYRDAFKKRRSSRFRLIFVGNGRDDPGSILPLVVTEGGNEAD